MPLPSLSLRRLVSGSAAVGLVATGAIAVATHSAAATPARATKAAPSWVGTWTASPLAGLTTATCPAGSGGLAGRTVRNIVHAGVGGSSVRVRITNVFGTAPLTVTDASVAVALTGASTVPGTLRRLTFSGHPSVTVPTGVELYSDPVQLAVQADQDLAVSVYAPKLSGAATYHPLAVQNSFLSTAGDSARSANAANYPTTITCWMLADGIDVPTTKRLTGSVIALGDSITDGYNSGLNANNRWPDVLGRRLVAADSPYSVVNEGISGNELLTDTPTAGVSILHRLDRDVLAQPNAKAVIMLIGINDIGQSQLGNRTPPTTARSLIAGYEQVISRVHAHGMKIYGATLTPYLTLPVPNPPAYMTAAGNRIREQVNAWIRTSGKFDGVVDFDKATQSPYDPRVFDPKYDSGDHLHPNDRGYTVMGDTVPDRWFRARS